MNVDHIGRLVLGALSAWTDAPSTNAAALGCDEVRHVEEDAIEA